MNCWSATDAAGATLRNNEARPVMPFPELFIYDTAAELFEAAAHEFAAATSAAVKSRSKFTVALSGGSTPKALYSLLADRYASKLPWNKMYFFFGDERHVPPNHLGSNYRMANEALLSRVRVPPANVFRVHAEEKDAVKAAQAYEQALRDFFSVRPGEFPRFDMVLLGVGPDGHAASLFPASAALAETERWVVANWVDKFKTHRITFTYPVINNAACVMFLSSGADKAAIVHQVLENPKAGLPSQAVQPVEGRLLWMIDRAAAAQLT
jgi:6-phosphogluconolactonase